MSCSIIASRTSDSIASSGCVVRMGSMIGICYLADPSKVVYRAKDGTDEKVFDALEWLAAMCPHIPDRGEQVVRYYGYYSTASRGLRQMKTSMT